MRASLFFEILIFSCTTAWSQSIVSTSIASDTEKIIRKRIESDILYYRAKLSPEFDYEKLGVERESNNQVLFHKDPRQLLLNDRGIEVPDAYKMALTIERWPENTPKSNYYLVTKKGMRFSNGQDTVDVDVFNKYFNQNDERYLVYFKPDSIHPDQGIYRNVSGAFFLDRVDRQWLNYATDELLFRLIHLRLAQFEGDIEMPFPLKTADHPEYRQFRIVNSTLTRSSLLAKVMKPYPYNSIELSYFTNDTTITKGDIRELYEVKYIISTNTSKYEDILPKITLLKDGWEFIRNKAVNEDKFWNKLLNLIPIPPTIKTQEIKINDQITSVRSTEEGIEINVKKGKKTVFMPEENTRYVISGKSKRKIIVTEKGEIINE